MFVEQVKPLIWLEFNALHSQNETNCICKWESPLVSYVATTKPKPDLSSLDAEDSGTPNSGTKDDRKNLNDGATEDQ